MFQTVCGSLFNGSFELLMSFCLYAFFSVSQIGFMPYDGQSILLAGLCYMVVYSIK